MVIFGWFTGHSRAEGRQVRLDEIELSRWGERIGETLRAPAVVVLSGPMGVGKSVLARAIGRGAGVADPMPSPSYNVLLRHPTPSGIDVVHIDLYRLESSDELWELGWSQLGHEPEIVLIEWPERAGSHLPADRWSVRLSSPERHPELRDIEVRRLGRPPELAGFPMSVSV
jgi:tRNA threonylcarbamoyladenosine biosynthesis protein TsaE